MNPDEPTPMQRAEHAAAVVADLAVARRLLAALHAGNADATQDICREFVASGRGVETTIATALQALEFGSLLIPDPPQRQRFLDALAFEGLDTAADVRKFLDEIGDGS
jgi:hypothetical protein